MQKKEEIIYKQKERKLREAVKVLSAAFSSSLGARATVATSSSSIPGARAIVASPTGPLKLVSGVAKLQAYSFVAKKTEKMSTQSFCKVALCLLFNVGSAFCKQVVLLLIIMIIIMNL